MPIQPHPRITIDGSSLNKKGPDYEYDVSGVLMTMKLSLVGIALIDSLQRNLWIFPHPDPGQNARATPTNRLDAQVAGLRSHSCTDMTPKSDENGNPLYGTGKGSDSVIRFTPREFLNNSTSQGKAIPVGVRRDEALFHEMVHSLRQMTGVMDCTPYPHDYDTKDDFFVILVTNIYSSAFHRPLRKNHVDSSVLTDKDVQSFYGKFESMIARLCGELPVLTRNIAQIPYIKFNPIRQYYRNHSLI